MHGVDTAVIVVNAQSGIEVNTRRVFNEAGKAGLGRMIVINKMDAENIDFPALVDAIREMWGSACVLLNVPVGHGAAFQRGGQHAQCAGRHAAGRCSIRKRSTIRCWSRSSRSTRR